MKCVVNWIPLNTPVHFENTQPCLEEKWERNGKGIHGGYGQSYGNGKGTGNLSMKKKFASVSLQIFENR